MGVKINGSCNSFCSYLGDVEAMAVVMMKRWSKVTCVGAFAVPCRSMAWGVVHKGFRAWRTQWVVVAIVGAI